MNKTVLGVRARIIIGFFALSIIFILFVSSSLIVVSKTENNANEVIKTELPVYNEFVDLNSMVYVASHAMDFFVMTGDEKYQTEFVQTIGLIEQGKSLIDDKVTYSKNEILNKKWSDIRFMLEKINQIGMKIIKTSDLNERKNMLQSDFSPTMQNLSDSLNVIDKNGSESTGIMDMQYVYLNHGSENILHDMSLLTMVEYVLFVMGFFASIIIMFVTIRSLANMTKGVTEAGQSMVSTVEEVRHAVDTQSAGASEQASSINEISASLSEIEKSSTQTMEKAKALGLSAERTREKGQQGLDAVDQSVIGMKKVRDKVQAIAQTILELSSQTQQVGEITSVVNNLAQQSKMLALNASIEAARAGEAGKGFSVVAVEVKNLAEQSETATVQVQKILENIRSAAEKAVMVTEEGTKGVDEGTDLIEQTGDLIRNLNDVIHETTIASQQIESAVRQESAGIEQIATGMSEINQVTASFIESVRQTTEAITHLADIAKNLKSYTDVYKI